MKVGVIRCRETENICPATTDIKMALERKGVFEGEDAVELIGIVSCGGCPGKNAVLRAKEIVKRGADTIAFASCVSKGNPLGFPCPNFEVMKRAVAAAVGEEIKILDYTH